MSSGDAGSNKPNVVFVLGVPGAGKGTQCDLIRKTFGYVHLSAGDLLRKEMKSVEGQTMSDLGKEIDGHIKKGSIVPVAITVRLLWGAMQEHMEKEAKYNFLIDGFPRNQDNMSGWNEIMSDKAKVKMVLFFDCPPEIGVDRCIKRGATSGRSDDNAESLKRRIDTYKNDSLPIIEEYRRQGLVREIRAEQTSEQVFEEVKKLFS
ncbi:UMP-CMP kinase-like [Lineus longissimus]|uniref:UMP-CMP kinase-like n=1 Tax=Lineus longissimus TaxID=88925 RepID=UPI002B4F752F